MTPPHCPNRLCTRALLMVGHLCDIRELMPSFLSFHDSITLLLPGFPLHEEDEMRPYPLDSSSHIDSHCRHAWQPHITKVSRIAQGFWSLGCVTATLWAVLSECPGSVLLIFFREMWNTRVLTFEMMKNIKSRILREMFILWKDMFLFIPRKA